MIFDDGTELVQDSSGNVSWFTDTSGRRYAPDNSSFTSLLSGVFGTLNEALRLRLVNQPAAQLQQQQAAIGQSQLIGLALLAGGAVLAFKLLKG